MRSATPLSCQRALRVRIRSPIILQVWPPRRERGRLARTLIHRVSSACPAAVQRITNFWANGTWKGPEARFGAYWHQDGQFWQRPRHNILSILHAQATPPAGGETGFADLRAARHTLSAPLLARAAAASIRASVRQIRDFAQGDEEDLATFPDARHPLLDHHLLDGGPLLYVGSPHMEVVGLESAAAGKALLAMLLAHATSPSFTYFHAWDVGDVLVWDNTQTLHHSYPYTNDGTNRRELFRTQARTRPHSPLVAKDEL
jgi:taurine dioxygenase